MIVKQRKFAAAITLIEVMAATAVLVIATTGTLSYQYHTARHVQIARAQVTATRTAQLLLEDWMSTGGSKNYNPATLGLGFSSALVIPSHFSQAQGQGLGGPLHDAVYAITVDDVPMLVMLTWKDVAHDAEADVTLRQLGVIVEFSEETQTTNRFENIKPVILTTYVRLDAAGG